MPSIQQRIHAFIALGKFLKDFRLQSPQPTQQKFHDDLQKLIPLCHIYNGWFTGEYVNLALLGLERMLDENKLTGFTENLKEPKASNTVALIMAGNIPAVGFHDMLCVLLSGHKVLIKVSSDDHVLIPFLAGMLIYFEPGLAPYINFSENRLGNFDAVIATGSNNTSKYFEYYFGKYPHIIRKNRNSAAVLDGTESREELEQLGHDVFDYFGLGCRNVSKLLCLRAIILTIFTKPFIRSNLLSTTKNTEITTITTGPYT